MDGHGGIHHYPKLAGHRDIRLPCGHVVFESETAINSQNLKNFELTLAITDIPKTLNFNEVLYEVELALDKWKTVSDFRLIRIVNFDN